MALSPNETEAHPAPPAIVRLRFFRLIELRSGFVWRFLRCIGLTEIEASSAAPRVFVTAARRLAERGSDRELSWLVSTALLIASQTQRERNEPPAPLSDSAPALEDLDDAQQSREILRVILEQMPLDLRVVFVLREVEGLTEGELAGVIGVSDGVARARLAEAHDEFATHLELGSDLAHALLSAAREERPPSALERALRGFEIDGMSGGASDGEADVSGESKSSFRYPDVSGKSRSSSRLRARPTSVKAGYALAAKWLFIGVLVGLALTAAGYGVFDAIARASDHAHVH